MHSVVQIWLVVVQEPDTYYIQWERNGLAPALTDVYLNLMDVLFKINQGVPFMVQGTGQAALANWGDGFITDKSVINSFPGMSDPNRFFTTLVGTPNTAPKPYLRQVAHLAVPQQLQCVPHTIMMVYLRQLQNTAQH